MASTHRLTQIELLTLAACAQLGPDAAYGVSVRDEIVERTGRRVTLGAVYKAVHRLEQRGYVSIALGASTAVRGGRAKKHVAVEPAGLSALARSIDEANRSVAAINRMAARLDFGGSS